MVLFLYCSWYNEEWLCVLFCGVMRFGVIFCGVIGLDVVVCGMTLRGVCVAVSGSVNDKTYLRHTSLRSVV